MLRPRGCGSTPSLPARSTRRCIPNHRAKLFEYEKYIPLGRMQRAEDLAGTAIFLASDASGYITGQTLHVNGGLIMND